MKLIPFLSHSKSLDPRLNSSPSSPPWPFPACANIKTLSFRDEPFRTYNSTFIDTQMTPPESFFTVSSSDSFSTASDVDSADPIESVIRGLRSDRLFFEPVLTSSLSIPPHNEKCQVQDQALQQSTVTPPANVEVATEEEEDHSTIDANDSTSAYKESEVLAMDSHNPCEDFRKSMEEMVEAHEVKDWQGLEELLGCYLEINGKNNHGFIMGAFIDLLVSLSFTNTNATTPTTTSISTPTPSTSSNSSNLHCSSPSSPLSLPSSSLSTTPCLSSLLDHDGTHNVHGDDADDEEEDEDNNDLLSSN